MEILSTLGVIIIAAAALGTLSHFFKQPIVLAYIVAGIIIGPYVLGLIHDSELIHVIGDIGIMLMLFLVGIEMNTEKIKDTGVVALGIGLAQILFTGGVGWLIVYLLGFDLTSSLYIALALTLSSTVVCVKILSDHKTLSSLYGKIVIGILLVQDIVALICLILLNSFATPVEHSLVLDFGILLAKGAVLGLVALFILKKPLATLYFRLAHSTELLILVSLSWCFLVALLAHYIGFSKEMGAFIAGLSLANLPYAMEITSKARIIRDFFITIFFVILGAGMTFTSLGNQIVPVILLSLFVIIGNPLIVLVVMKHFGFDNRTSFFTGISIAQISEFSLILAALGVKLGHIGDSTIALISILAIVTISVSSYMTAYQQQLYRLCKPLLDLLPHRKSKHTEAHKVKADLFDHIIMLGCGSGGHQFLETLQTSQKSFIVVDHDPAVVNELNRKNIHCIFGDVQDEELFHTINVAKADLIVSFLPHVEDNFFILNHLRELKHHSKPIFIAIVNTGHEGFAVFEKGADYVVVKSSLEAQHLRQLHENLYQLPSCTIENKDHCQTMSLSELKKTMLEDKEYARIVHELSKLRLQEIQTLRSKH